MPVDLHPQPPRKPKQFCITPVQLFLMAFVVLFILAIIFAWCSRGAYYYNSPLA